MIEFIAQHWFLNTVSVTLGIGLVAFISKVFAERKYDIRFVNLILYGFMSVYALLYAWLMGFVALSSGQYVLIIFYGVQIYSYSFIMIVALRYLPTSTFFIGVRLLSSFTLLAIGMVFFGDSINLYGTVGFLLGVVAMILLFEREEKPGLDYKKGSLLLGAGVLALVFGHTTHKVFSTSSEMQPTVLAIAFATAFVCAIVVGYNRVRDNMEILMPVLKLNLIQATLAFYYFVMLFNVYNIGNLGISYKIQSYSPFVPIILASLIYHEKISTKKKIALVLVAISLWFFY